MMANTSNSEKISWIQVPLDSDFSIYNIPFGIFSYKDDKTRAATRIGDTVIDLSVLAEFGFFDQHGIQDLNVFSRPYLNDFISLGKPVTSKVRERLISLFSISNNELKNNQEVIIKAFFKADEVTMHMPVKVGNYTDFYASEQHAYNVGVMFRDPKNALLPNWKHIPVGYHGRASSIVISGTSIHRPKGQTKSDDQDYPVFGPTKQLDFELEIGFVIGQSTALGDSVKVTEAEDYIFGIVLFNDLSARDIQKWEYVPLGPFLSKNFGSVISPWIVTLEALKPFRIPGPVQIPEVLDYLKYNGGGHFDIKLEIHLFPTADRRPPTADRRPPTADRRPISSSNSKHLYWNFAQMLAHHTCNGCNIEVGDIYGSGTISGPEPGSYGSMLELAWKGTKPLELPDGTTRKFIEDYDTIVMKGYAEKEGMRIGFGECSTQILPAK